MNFKSQPNTFKSEKHPSSIPLLPFHKTKQSSLYRPKKKRSLKSLACSCSVNRSNLLIAISEHEQEFGAPVAVQFCL